MTARELDDARQQVADLRAGIEALTRWAVPAGFVSGEHAEERRRIGLPEVVAVVRADEVDALAGSGEQPGEAESRTRAGFRYCETCRVRVDDEHGHDRPAPVVPDSADVTEKVARAIWQAETEYDYAWEPNADTYRDAARNLLAVLADPDVQAGIAGVLREHGWVYTQPVTASRCVCDERPDDMAEHQATAVADWLRGRG